MEPNLTVAPGITMTPEGGSPVPLLTATVGETPEAPEMAPPTLEIKEEPKIQEPEKPTEVSPVTPIETTPEIKAPEDKKEEEVEKPKKMTPSEEIKDAKDLGEALKAFAKNKGHEKPELMGDLAAKCAELGKPDDAMSWAKLAAETTNSLRNRETQESMRFAMESLDQSTKTITGAIDVFKESSDKVGKASENFMIAKSGISAAVDGFQKVADKIAASIRR